MRITTKIENAKVMAVNEVPSKDGSKTYYQMAIFTADRQAGMIPTSEDVFNLKLSEGSVCDLTCEYNDQYDSFRCVGIRKKEK